MPTCGDHGPCGRHLLRAHRPAPTGLAARHTPPASRSTLSGHGAITADAPASLGGPRLLRALWLLGPVCTGLSGTCHTSQTRHAPRSPACCCRAPRRPGGDVWSVSVCRFPLELLRRPEGGPRRRRPWSRWSSRCASHAPGTSGDQAARVLRARTGLRGPDPAPGSRPHASRERYSGASFRRRGACSWLAGSQLWFARG